MFGQQLRKYRKLAYMTQKDLAYRIELITGKTCKPEYISSYESGSNPKIDVIEAIIEVLGIPAQFLFDDSDKALNKIVDNKIPLYQSFSEHTKKVKLIDGYVGAGSAGYLLNEENIIDYLYVDNFMVSKLFINKDIKALIVIGDSMKGYVDTNDIVLFWEIPKDNYHLTDGKYIITTINGTMLKNLQFRSNGDIIISSCNKSYRDEIIKSNESQEYLDIVGIVVGRILKS